MPFRRYRPLASSIAVRGTVRSNKKGNIGFVSDKRRLNAPVLK